MVSSVCILAGAKSLILLRRHEAVVNEKSDRSESTAQLSEGSEEVGQYCWVSCKRYGIDNDSDKPQKGLDAQIIKSKKKLH